MLNWHRTVLITGIGLFSFLFLLAATQPARAQGATITPTATLTAPVAPALTAPITATVATTGTKRLHVRSGPGLNYPILYRLYPGERTTVLSRDSSGRWVQLSLPQTPAGSGWVAASYLALSAPVTALPVATTVSSAPLLAPVGPLPAPAPPGQLPLSGRLAVPVFDPNQGAYNVYLVNADGSGWRLVATDASAPALSDDGSRLAYRHWRTDDRGIVVANADGSAPWRLTDKLEDTLPSFSPDGKKIVFSSYREGDRKSRIYYVWSDEQKLRAWEWGDGGDYGVDPYWLADGQIVYRGLWPATELWIMNGDATGQRRIFVGPEPVAIAGAPDSSQIAFMAAENGNWDIYALMIGATTARRLTTDPANDGLPAWSPDGRALAFVSDRGGRWGLWAMNADGTNQRLLSALPGAADGRVLFEPDYLNHGWVEEQIGWGR